jgi:16S rRNA (guanine527-N7)-methyltransferase
MDVPRETRDRLDRLRDLVVFENEVQNLISPNTIDRIEERHIKDSLQLLRYVPPGVLVDIGSGAGFPGLVLACCRSDPVHLVEPRAKRAAFLERAVADLALGGSTTVWQCRIERVVIPDVMVITARAVASLTDLFDAANHLPSPRTRWVLPKGRAAQSELDTARLSWQGDFELVPSETDPYARIVLASNVHRRR